MDIALVLHSRIKENAKDGEKYSEVMTEIANGAKNWLTTNFKEVKDVNLQIYSPKDSYADAQEFTSLVGRTVKETPDAIILPFSLCETEYEDLFVDFLSIFDGCIVGINVPPIRRAIRETNYIGYVGGDEITAGKRLVDNLLDAKPDLKKIFILNHKENHYGLRLRINGVHIQSGRKNLEDENDEICIDPESDSGKDIKGVISAIKTSNNMACQKFENNFGIATLGVRGTEMAIEIKKEMGINFPIVGMDINDKVKQAIQDKIVFSTLIQQPTPYSQGWQAMAMAYNYLKKIICEPKIISLSNVHEVQ